MVPGYPDYEVSSLGSVRRPVGGFRKTAIGLKSRMRNQYLSVSIKHDGEGLYRNHSLHRILAASFIPNPENLPCVNHKDGNKLNNNLSNLEWVTYKQNSDHAIQNGLINNHGEGNRQHVLKSDKVIELVGHGRAGASYASLARKHGVSESTICDIFAGKTWSRVTGIKQKQKLAA